MKIDHSKLPWEKSQHKHYLYADDGKFLIADFGYDDALTWNQKQDNLDFAIKACNMHNDLVSALTECIEALHAEGIIDEDVDPVISLLEKAK